MENWLIANADILLKCLASVVCIFVIIITITRISGLRTFAKMSSFDFASTIAIGSILASVIMNSGQSILKGAVALTSIVAFQSLFALVVRKSDWAKKMFTNKPMLLMYKGEILNHNMDKTNVGMNDLIAKLREANVLDYQEVKAVILESTGDMSVIHTSDDKQVSAEILQDVEGVPHNHQPTS